MLGKNKLEQCDSGNGQPGLSQGAGSIENSSYGYDDYEPP